jgi:hypothetical protein
MDIARSDLVDRDEALPGEMGPLDRRRLLQRAALGALGTSFALGGLAEPADARKRKHRRRKKRPNILTDAGVGMYTDKSVAQQISGFTINPSMVSCAVGTFAPGDGPTGSNAGGFSMLMYALTVDNLAPDREPGILRANGRMRSITVIGGRTQEDAKHDYIAVARDGRGSAPDRFDIHFKTPFWTPGSNPLATPSSDYPGLARFGGDVQLGQVTVRR